MSAEENEVTADLARKLTAKGIVGNVRRFVPKFGDDGKPTGEIAPLYEIYGQANGTKRGEGDNGPWVALLGRFEAVNITRDEDGNADGSVQAAPVAFLHEPVSTMLAQELERMEPEKDADGKPVMVNGEPKLRRAVDSVEFAFRVGVKATESTVGYEYVVTPIIKHGGADPLADLRKRVKTASLAAPPKNPALPPAEGGKKGGKK